MKSPLAPLPASTPALLPTPCSPQASVACTHLEDALQLLPGASGGRVPLAPSLVAEIRGSLRSLRAPSIQEELLGSAG